MSGPQPNEWQIDAVCEWLASVGLQHLQENFTANKIDGSTLLGLDREDIRTELGIESLSDRKRLWQHVSALQDDTLNADESSPRAAASERSGPADAEALHILLTSPGLSPGESTRETITSRSLTSLIPQTSRPQGIARSLSSCGPTAEEDTISLRTDFTWSYKPPTSPTSSGCASSDLHSEYTFRSGGSGDAAAARRPKYTLRVSEEDKVPTEEAGRVAKMLCKSLVLNCGEATTGAFGSLLRASQKLTEQILGRLLVGLAPTGVSQDDASALHKADPAAPLPGAAVTLLRAYGATASERTVTLGIAAEALRQPGTSLDRFVRDALRVCESVSVSSRGVPVPLKDWQTVVQTMGLHEVLPDALAALEAQARSSERRQRRSHRIRLKSPSLTAEETGDVKEAVAVLKRMVPPCPSVSGIASLFRKRSELLDIMLRVLIDALTPSSSSDPDAPLPLAGVALLQNCGVSVDDHAGTASPSGLTLPVAVEVLRRSRGVDRLVAHALRACEDVSEPPRRSAPILDGDLFTFVSVFRLSTALQSIAKAGVHKDPISSFGVPPPILPSRPAELVENFSVGDEVLILDDVMAVQDYIAGIPRLGWQDEMSPYCGTLGKVKRYDAKDKKAGKVRVQHSDLMLWTWPVAAITKRPTCASPPSQGEECKSQLYRLRCAPGATWQVRTGPSENDPITHASVAAGSEVMVNRRKDGWLRIAGGGWVLEKGLGLSGWVPVTANSQGTSADIEKSGGVRPLTKEAEEVLDYVGSAGPSEPASHREV